MEGGLPSSCPRFATSTTRQASSWIANPGHEDGIPSSLHQCGVIFFKSQAWEKCLFGAFYADHTYIPPDCPAVCV